MISKTILVGLVAISFVAGSIMTGTLVYGAPTDPLVAIKAAIANLQARMTAVETVNTNQNTAISAIQTLNTNQNTAISAIQTLNTNQQTQIDVLSAQVGKSGIFATNLELVPITGKIGMGINPTSVGVLFFGDTLCGSADTYGGQTLYIAFGGNTLVQHDTSCPIGLTAKTFLLEGDVDTNFKKGDVLVIEFDALAQKWIEVYREQTP